MANFRPSWLLLSTRARSQLGQTPHNYVNKRVAGRLAHSRTLEGKFLKEFS